MRWIGYALAAAVLAVQPAAAQEGPALSPAEQQARTIFERLISFRTAQGHGQVPAMVDYIAETLRAGGVAA